MSFFFFNDPATTAIYTLSLHDALPICCHLRIAEDDERLRDHETNAAALTGPGNGEALQLRVITHVVGRSEEHTSELQSLAYLVCRLLLEKKKKKIRVMSLMMSHTLHEA